MQNNKIPMDAMPYEYMLHTWGGFYNKEHQEKHGELPGYEWFPTAAARQKRIDELKSISDKLNARTLATNTEEGHHTRFRTVAKMDLVYQDKTYPIEYDFGFAYPEESADFMFYEGNYSCDCNLSIFIEEQHGIDIGLSDSCGCVIEIDNFTIEAVPDMDYSKS
jgi:hypothetical protein